MSGDLTPWDVQSKRIVSADGVSPCLPSGTNEGMNIQPTVCIQDSMIGRKDENGPQGDGINTEQSFTLNCTDRHAVSYKVNASEEARLCGGDGNTAGALTANSSFNRQNIIVDHAVCFAQNNRNEVRLQSGDGAVTGPIAASDSAKGQGVPFVMATGQANAEVTENMTPTLNCAHEQPIVVDRAAFNQGKNAAYPPPHREVGFDERAGCEGAARCGVQASNGEQFTGALCARDYKGVGTQFVNEGKVICQRMSSR